VFSVGIGGAEGPSSRCHIARIRASSIPAPRPKIYKK
jgi:hypothetical protein